MGQSITLSHGSSQVIAQQPFLLHNNSVNRLTWAQSLTVSPHVSQAGIYVPNVGDWATCNSTNV